MTFAKQDFDFPYWQRQNQPLFADLAWNIPERKTGHINVVGGNAQGFHGMMRFAEILARDFPVQTVNLLLPDSLRNKVPPLTNLEFAASTENGAFAKSSQLEQAFLSNDMSVVAGDLSRNAATAAALSAAIQSSINAGISTPLLIMRDAVDLLAPEAATVLSRPNLILLASMAQLQKIFKAVYYPRMLILSQPLTMAIETLHKFTMSYTLTILTFHDQQIIVANGGEVSTTPLQKAKYSILELWSGDLAAKVAAYNLYNPSVPFKATTAAIMATTP